MDNNHSGDNDFCWRVGREVQQGLFFRKIKNMLKNENVTRAGKPSLL